MLKRLLPWMAPALFVVVAIAIQTTVSALEKDFYLTQLILALYYSVVVVGLGLVMGYAGQVSIGHAAFFAIGGYTSAVLTTRNLYEPIHAMSLRETGDTTTGLSAAAIEQIQELGWVQFLEKARILVVREDLWGASLLTVSPMAAFVVALLLTAAIAALIGYPALRLKGHYLAMATLGFGMIVYRVLVGSQFTGAADGIVGVPRWELPFGLAVTGARPLRVQNFYIACGVVLVVMVLLSNIVRSRVGRALQAIHDRELASNAMGIDTARTKLKAFVLSAVLAAAAGVFITHFTGGIGPSEAGPLKSVRYLALVAAGGMTNLWGMLVVSTGINFMSLRGMFGSYDHAVFGGLLVLIISLTPQGPLEPLRAWVRRRRERTKLEKEEAEVS